MAAITAGKCCEGSVRVHACEGARDSVGVTQEGLLCGRKQLRWNRRITPGGRGRVDQGPGKGRECLDSRGQLAEHGATAWSARSFRPLFILRTIGSHFSVLNIGKTR